MKKLFILTASLTIICFSCKKETGNLSPNSSQNMMTDPGNSGPNVKTVPYIWKVNSLVISGNDMTAQLAEYSFDIQAPTLSTGVYSIKAVSGSNTYFGKWNRITYGEVIIAFSSDAPSSLRLLNDTWSLINNQQYDIVMQTASKSLSFHTNGETWPDDQ